MLLFNSVGALRHISCCKCIHIHTYNQCQEQTDSVNFASGPNPPGVIVQLKNSDWRVKLETHRKHLLAEHLHVSVENRFLIKK